MDPCQEENVGRQRMFAQNRLRCALRRKLSRQLDAGGCGRKRRKGEREQGSQRRGKKKGKRKVEGERKRVETKRICLDLFSSKVFEVLCPDSEVESVGNSWVLRCVCVLVVTVLFSDVNVDVVCEAVFSDSDCAFVKPQAFFSCISRLHDSTETKDKHEDTGKPVA